MARSACEDQSVQAVQDASSPRRPDRDGKDRWIVSSSVKRGRLARTRAKYTGEPRSAAEAGVPRELDGLGLDECTPEQLEFRALLALGFFNRGPIAAPPGAWDLSALTWYTLAVSPGWDYLFLHSDAPDNVARRINPLEGYGGLPGLRLQNANVRDIGHWWFGGIHLHTRAQFTLAGIWPAQLRNRGFRARDLSEACVGSVIAGEVNASESNRSRAIPRISPDAQWLLAGLFVRLNVTDPKAQWATGNWFYDPLRRGLPHPAEGDSGPERRLWGADDDWELLWNGYPHTEDVVAAMTDPVAGLSGASSARHRDGYDLTYGTARLHIRRWRV